MNIDPFYKIQLAYNPPPFLGLIGQNQQISNQFHEIELLKKIRKLEGINAVDNMRVIFEYNSPLLKDSYFKIMVIPILNLTMYEKQILFERIEWTAIYYTRDHLPKSTEERPALNEYNYASVISEHQGGTLLRLVLGNYEYGPLLHTRA